MKSGASSSSSVCRSPLAKASRKRRASALLLSSDDIRATSSLLLRTPVSLSGRHHEYDATRRDHVHRLEAYSPKCVEEKFSEVRRSKQLRQPPPRPLRMAASQPIDPETRRPCAIRFANTYQAVATRNGAIARKIPPLGPRRSRTSSYLPSLTLSTAVRRVHRRFIAVA